MIKKLLAVAMLCLTCLGAGLLTAALASTGLNITVHPEHILIGAGYNGEHVTVSGKIPFDASAFIRVTGKPENNKLKQKGKAMGVLWMNLGSVEISKAPDVFLLYLPEDASHDALQSGQPAWRSLGIGPEHLRTVVGIVAEDASKDAVFDEFIKLNKKSGLYGIVDNAVHYDQNDKILELIADMGDKLGGDYVFGRQYINDSCDRMGALVYELIYNFNALAPRTYPSLDGIFRHIKRDIDEELAGRVVIPQTEYVIPYDIITGDFDDVVGGKNTHIAEIRNRLGIPVPEGFAITTRAFRSFFDHNRFQDRLAHQLSDWRLNRLSTEDASRKIMAMISSGTLTPVLTEAIRKALRQLQKKMGSRHLLLAVRSSTMGEDSEHTFAGQYMSFLNQPQQRLLQCYKDVLPAHTCHRPWSTDARRVSRNTRWRWPLPVNA